jgi:hypothetical protein
MSSNPNHPPAYDRREREPALIGPDVERLLRSYQERFQSEREEPVTKGESIAHVSIGIVSAGCLPPSHT